MRLYGTIFIQFFIVFIGNGTSELAKFFCAFRGKFHHGGVWRVLTWCSFAPTGHLDNVAPCVCLGTHVIGCFLNLACLAVFPAKIEHLVIDDGRSLITRSFAQRDNFVLGHSRIRAEIAVYHAKLKFCRLLEGIDDVGIVGRVRSRKLDFNGVRADATNHWLGNTSGIHTAFHDGHDPFQTFLEAHFGGAGIFFGNFLGTLVCFSKRFFPFLGNLCFLFGRDAGVLRVEQALCGFLKGDFPCRLDILRLRLEMLRVNAQSE